MATLLVKVLDNTAVKGSYGSEGLEGNDVWDSRRMGKIQ